MMQIRSVNSGGLVLRSVGEGETMQLGLGLGLGRLMFAGSGAFAPITQAQFDEWWLASGDVDLDGRWYDRADLAPPDEGKRWLATGRVDLFGRWDDARDFAA